MVSAYRRGKSDDVILVPVSIAYDQIQDVGDYVAEQRGGAKERESLRWFFRLVRSLHRGYGTIHVRFGEPVSLQKFFGPPDTEAPSDADHPSIDLQKLAFEVCVRINRVTPITPTSLVAIGLLGAGDQALSIDEIPRTLKNLLDYVESRHLPTTEELKLDTREGLQKAVDNLVERGRDALFRGAGAGLPDRSGPASRGRVLSQFRRSLLRQRCDRGARAPSSG